MNRVGPRPVWCLVTDRRRTAGAGATRAAQHRALIALIAEAADAGIGLIHIREQDLTSRELHALVAEAVAVTRGSSSRVVASDRADVALAAGADGVHLPASAPPVARVRALGPSGWIVGRSAHSPEEVRAAATADYLIFGTVFETASKPGVTGQGLSALADAVGQVDVPVVAIGGITIERARACAAAGAAGVAAISLFLPPAAGGAGPGAAVKMLREAFNVD